MLKNKPRPRQDEDDKRKADKAKKRQDKDKTKTRKDKKRLNYKNNIRKNKEPASPTRQQRLQHQGRKTKGEMPRSLPLITAGPKLPNHERVRPPPTKASQD